MAISTFASCEQEEVNPSFSDSSGIKSQALTLAPTPPTLSVNGWLKFVDTTNFYAAYDSLFEHSSTHSPSDDQYWTSEEEDNLPSGFKSLRAVYDEYHTWTQENGEEYVIPANLDMGSRDYSLLSYLRRVNRPDTWGTYLKVKDGADRPSRYYQTGDQVNVFTGAGLTSTLSHTHCQ